MTGITALRHETDQSNWFPGFRRPVARRRSTGIGDFSTIQSDSRTPSDYVSALAVASNSDPGWEEVRERIDSAAVLQPNWDTYGGSPPDRATLAYAITELTSLRRMGFPPPSVSVSGDGQLLAAWTGGDIEVELWFEGPYQETAIIDDKRGEAEFTGPDRNLSRTISALRKMQTRT